MNERDDIKPQEMNADALYREEVFTDRKVGTIRRLTPVKSDGTIDDSRPEIFTGQTQILTTAGTLPLNFEIEAQSLAEAAAKFSDAAKEGFEKTMKELEQMRREAASSIVVPERGAGGFGGLGGPGGIGGGKIQVP